MNLYEELGLPKTATSEQIKQRYKSLAQQHHPDKGGDEEKFKRIKQAYEILIDPAARAHYDNTGQIPEPDNKRSEAISALASLLNSLLVKLNPDTEDLVLMMRVEVNKKKTMINSDIGTCTNFIAKLEKTLKKLKRKKQGENILSNFISEQIKTRKAELIRFNYHLAICDLMLEILEDYHFSLEEWVLMLVDNTIVDVSSTDPISN